MHIVPAGESGWGVSLSTAAFVLFDNRRLDGEIGDVPPIEVDENLPRNRLDAMRTLRRDDVLREAFGATPGMVTTWTSSAPSTSGVDGLPQPRDRLGR